MAAYMTFDQKLSRYFVGGFLVLAGLAILALVGSTVFSMFNRGTAYPSPLGFASAIIFLFALGVACIWAGGALLREGFRAQIIR